MAEAPCVYPRPLRGNTDPRPDADSYTTSADVTRAAGRGRHDRGRTAGFIGHARQSTAGVLHGSKSEGYRVTTSGSVAQRRIEAVAQQLSVEDRPAIQ